MRHEMYNAWSPLLSYSLYQTLESNKSAYALAEARLIMRGNIFIYLDHVRCVLTLPELAMRRRCDLF